MWLDLNSASALRPSGRAAERGERHRRAGRAGAHDLAVDDVERAGRGLHQLGGRAERRLAQLHRRHAGRLAAHHRDARGKGAHAFVDAVGLAVHDLDAGVVDAERLGGDLRDHGFHALADRGDAGDDFDGAARGLTSMRTLSNGPSPLFSTNIAKPAPTISPAARRCARVALHRRPVGRRQQPCRAAWRSRRSRRRCRCRACRSPGCRASRFWRSDCGGGLRWRRCRSWRRSRRSAARARRSSRSGRARDRCRRASCW